MDQRSVFFEEWLSSLREQYKYVVQSKDSVTLPTLTAVMQQVGFGEDELAQLRVEATMHIDDVDGDFVADMNILDETPTAQPHPSECFCPQCVTIDENQFDEDGQPISPDPEQADNETGHVFPAADTTGIDDTGETEPVTFEDSVAATVDDADEQSTVAEQADKVIDKAEDDPDAPAQMSMF